MRPDKLLGGGGGGRRAGSGARVHGHGAEVEGVRVAAVDAQEVEHLGQHLKLKDAGRSAAVAGGDAVSRRPGPPRGPKRLLARRPVVVPQDLGGRLGEPRLELHPLLLLRVILLPLEGRMRFLFNRLVKSIVNEEEINQ